jgi:protoporphyrinogen oxidase
MMSPEGVPAPRNDAERKIAVIIGAGPAGLTAAYELLTRTNIKPIILERTNHIGGLSRTDNYKGNRIDIGGHRFFSKSDRVMNWWLEQMPLEQNGTGTERIAYHGMSHEIAAAAASGSPQTVADFSKSGGRGIAPGLVMLLRRRKSRIYFLRKFFDYPITLSFDTLRKLGLVRTVRAGLSYVRSALFPLRDVRNLEQFFINRFGLELYRTFFQSYTEKVWGVSCREISAEWGEQRIKGLSISKSISHFLRQQFRRSSGIAQKETETSLIEQFLYPRLGPGQLWEAVAEKIVQMGGEIHASSTVAGLHCRGSQVVSVAALTDHGEARNFAGDYFFSTMPVKELVAAMDAPVPANVREVSDGLLYRDFITVGLLARKLKVAGKNGPIADNWIYIQEPDVLAGRLQIFNNWSPDMVADPRKMWIGVEYFCYQTDKLWSLSDLEMAAFAAAELDKIGILSKGDVLDSVVIRMPKTYPAYFGTYHRFDEVRRYLDGFDNLFLIGRNGMHRYNNQDHSMLTAMLAVDNVAFGRTDKSNLWDVNTEMESHEMSQSAEKTH